MVIESYANVSPSLYGSSPSRSQESKRAGFQNMHEQIRKKSVASQQQQQAATTKAANNMGSMFRDRDHFNSLHFC